MAKPLPLATNGALNKIPGPDLPLRWSGADAAPSLEEAPQTSINSNHSHSATAESDMNHVLKNPSHLALGGKPRPEAGPDELQELELLRHENAQLRSLCIELEQALQEASQGHGHQTDDERVREYEALLDEKTETIRLLHQELQNAHTIVAEMENQVNEAMEHRPPAGPAPREEELLALSEELQRERRQLQEDEQTLMDQMREMEVSMARERAEMARQRNDLGRLQSDIRHEMERLEKSGTAVRKMEELKRQFADATTRRGLATSSGNNAAQQQPQPQQPQPQQPPAKKDSGGLMGRLFGGK